MPEEADLSLDKSKIVVSASPKGERRHSLYLIDVAGGAGGRIERLETGLTGDQDHPRFADGGRSLLFTAPSKSGRESHSNPTRVHELRLSDRSVTELAADPGGCQLASVELANGELALVSTSCFISYRLERTVARRAKAETLSSLSGLLSEVAASPDGKKLVYTNREAGGRTFYVVEGGGPARRLATVLSRTDRMQPRFVCPKNLLFLRGRSVWTLDSESGATKNLLSLDEKPNQGGNAK